MIPDEKRQAILLLAEQGIKVRDICRKMDVSRNTVRNVIRHPELKPLHEHDAQLLIWVRDAFIACRGNAVRMAEVIRDSHDLDLPYSTLTRVIRNEQLRKPPQRSGTYTYEPGAEMQHDTSPHRILIGDTPVIAQCASLVLAYSRRVAHTFMNKAACRVTQAVRIKARCAGNGCSIAKCRNVEPIRLCDSLRASRRAAIRSVATSCHSSRYASTAAPCGLTTRRLAACGFIHKGMSLSSIIPTSPALSARYFWMTPCALWMGHALAV